jgi:hypothetical protein
MTDNGSFIKVPNPEEEERMSFGFAIGDFISVEQLAWTLLSGLLCNS